MAMSPSLACKGIYLTCSSWCFHGSSSTGIGMAYPGPVLMTYPCWTFSLSCTPGGRYNPESVLSCGREGLINTLSPITTSFLNLMSEVRCMMANLGRFNKILVDFENQ